MQEVPGSNPTRAINCLFFVEIFLKVALFARPISMPFLKSPGHEDSEKVYHVYGGQKFARLAVREVCTTTKIGI